MKTTIHTAAILMMLLLPYNALIADDSDSLNAVLPGIEVRADRIYSNPALKSSSVSLVDREDIKEIGAIQLSDAVSYSPGVFIKNYGGLGGIKTVSLRGTTSQQSLVLIDGMRLNSGQTGMTDLSTMPMALINDIEIARGGVSAVYGGNAIGGIINIRTSDKVKNDGINADLKYGSFAEKYVGITGQYGFNKTNMSALFEYTASDGDYPFDVNHFGEYRTISRTNGDFENFAASLAANSEFYNWEIKSRLLFRNTERGTPGPVVQGNVEAENARLSENDILFLLSAFRQISSETSLNIGISAQNNDMEYSDLNNVVIVSNHDNSGFNNQNYQLSARLSSDFNYLSGDLMFETSFNSLNGDMLQKEIGNYVKRNSYAVSAYIESDKLTAGAFHSLMSLGTRYDYMSDAGSSLSPLAGIIISNDFVPIELKCQWSYNFRAPSFNEMFYLNYGNADLEPEYARSLNIGLVAEPLENIELQAEYFRINTENQIVSVPKSPLTWSAQNIGEVFTRGFELSAGASLWDNFISLHLAYTRQKASDESENSITKGKQIVYIPQELFALNLITRLKDYSLGANCQYSGFRYSLADNSYSSVLPEYTLVNIFASKQFEFNGFNLLLRAECNNIGDESYSVIKNYPMPGRSYRLSVSVNI